MAPAGAILASIVAVCLLSWCGMERGKTAGHTLSSPRVLTPERRAVAEASRGIGLSDDLRGGDGLEPEVSLVFGWEPLLPVRLDEDLSPARSADSDIVLPSSLRF